MSVYYARRQTSPSRNAGRSSARNEDLEKHTPLHNIISHSSQDSANVSRSVDHRTLLNSCDVSFRDESESREGRTRSEIVESPSQTKKPVTTAQAGAGMIPKMRNLVFGETHAKKDITAKIAPVYPSKSIHLLYHP